MPTLFLHGESIEVDDAFVQTTIKSKQRYVKRIISEAFDGRDEVTRPECEIRLSIHTQEAFFVEGEDGIFRYHHDEHRHNYIGWDKDGNSVVDESDTKVHYPMKLWSMSAQ